MINVFETNLGPHENSLRYFNYNKANDIPIISPLKI